MKRIAIASAALVFGALAVTLATAAQQTQPGTISVQRDPGCGCCLQWVAHLKAAGFKTHVTESSNMTVIKDSKGVPRQARSCHTGTIDGYVIEGHVPAEDIKRLLKERPAIAGLAVAAMPIGSPGMEVPGGKVESYDVLAFDKTGRVTVWAKHGR